MENWKDGLNVSAKSAGAKKKKSKNRKESWSSVEEPDDQDPNQLMHSPPTMPVLYVCKGMSSSVGEAMAAARDRATRYSSVQQDTTLGFPYQVPRPDGEERHHTRKHITGSEQEAEIMREYIKPPANKTLFDVDCDGPHRSCSVGVFPTQTECGVAHAGIHHHRHSAPLDARSSHHPPVSASSSSSSSSSSSLPGWGCGDEGRGSPRRGRKAGGMVQRSPLMANLSPFSSKCERSSHTSQQEECRRGRHQGGLGTSSPSPSHDPSIPLPYCPSTSTLADITMVPVPCGPSIHSPSSSHPGDPGGSHGAHMGSLGIQGDLLHTYGQSSQSPCSLTANHDLPPLYSDVIENSSLFTSASRPSEQRTKSGEI
nr:nucleolar and coiled-body phosphoprotein 1-like isoform X2 [Procambarus clarkii]XP_045614464.1 nucleolar and coiled-body phosphoprotein 1-like isoform X2 [Procambarus clarkii]